MPYIYICIHTYVFSPFFPSVARVGKCLSILLICQRISSVLNSNLVLKEVFLVHQSLFKTLKILFSFLLVCLFSTIWRWMLSSLILQSLSFNDKDKWVIVINYSHEVHSLNSHWATTMFWVLIQGWANYSPRIWPTACFCTDCELRIVFTRLKDCKDKHTKKQRRLCNRDHLRSVKTNTFLSGPWQKESVGCWSPLTVVEMPTRLTLILGTRILST